MPEKASRKLKILQTAENGILIFKKFSESVPKKPDYFLVCQCTKLYKKSTKEFHIIKWKIFILRDTGSNK